MPRRRRRHCYQALFLSNAVRSPLLLGQVRQSVDYTDLCVIAIERYQCEHNTFLFSSAKRAGNFVNKNDFLVYCANRSVLSFDEGGRL